jgi:hypothetical protein
VIDFGVCCWIILKYCYSILISFSFGSELCALSGMIVVVDKGIRPCVCFIFRRIISRSPGHLMFVLTDAMAYQKEDN